MNAEIDDRVVIIYCNPRTAREHRIIVPVEKVPEKLEFQKRHGNICSVIPLSLIVDEKYR